MLNINEHRKRARQLADLLPWACLIGPGVVLNKDGSFQATIRFRGPDADTATAHEKMAYRARIHNTLRRFGDGYCLHIESRRTRCKRYTPGTFRCAAVQLIENERAKLLRTEPAYESAQYLTLTYLPPADHATSVASFLFTKPEEDEASPVSYKGYRDTFIRQVDQLTDLLKGVCPEARRLDDMETLGFLHDAVSERHLCPAVPDIPFYIDALLTDSPLRAGLKLRLGSKHLRTLSVRGYPGSTTPFKLQKLDELPIEFRWVVRFIPLDKAEAKSLLARLRRQWFAKRKSAWSLVKEVMTKTESALDDPESYQKTSDIEEAIDELASDKVTYGYFTLTVTTWGDSDSEADENLDAIRQVLDDAQFVTACESVNALSAWLGSLPGSVYADVRRAPLSTLNLCDLMPFATTWTGPPAPEVVQQCDQSLVETKTVGSTPFHLSLHQGDVGNTLIVGPTGKGKSTLLNLLAAQWLRYPNAQVFAFDVGGSGRVLTHAVGGDFNELGHEQNGPVFQPLLRVDQETERVWAQGWVLDLATHSGVELDVAAKDELWSALNILATRPKNERTLSTLWGLVQDEAVRQAIFPYTVDGPYGILLDADDESLRDDPWWQVFELEALRNRDAELIPVLTYLFHRLESRFDASRPTLLVLDEAWTFLDQGTFSNQIRTWLKTLRKKNVAVVFSTQSLSDINESPIATSIVESCMTQVFLPNDKATKRDIKEAYMDMGLNESQVRVLHAAMPKRDYLYYSTQGSRLFQLGLGPVALSLCGTSWLSDMASLKPLLDREPGEDFLRGYLDHVGLTPTAKELGFKEQPYEATTH